MAANPVLGKFCRELAIGQLRGKQTSQISAVSSLERHLTVCFQVPLVRGGEEYRCRTTRSSERSGGGFSRRRSERSERKVFRCPACLTETLNDGAALAENKKVKVKVKLVRKKRGAATDVGGKATDVGGKGGDVGKGKGRLDKIADVDKDAGTRSRRSGGLDAGEAACRQDETADVDKDADLREVGKVSSTEDETADLDKGADLVARTNNESSSNPSRRRKRQKGVRPAQGNPALVQGGMKPPARKVRGQTLKDEISPALTSVVTVDIKRPNASRQNCAQSSHLKFSGPDLTQGQDEASSLPEIQSRSADDSETLSSSELPEQWHGDKSADDAASLLLRSTLAESKDEDALARIRSWKGPLPSNKANSLFHGLCTKDHWKAASELLALMQTQRWWVERPALHIQLLFCLARKVQPRAAEELVLKMNADGRPLRNDVLTALMQAYVSGGWLDKACALMDSMGQSEEWRPSKYACNVLLKALLEAREIKAAELLFEDMVAQGLSTTISHNMMIHSRAYVGPTGCAALRADVARMHALGVAPDSSTYNIMIHAFLQAGQVEGAIRTLYAKHGAGFPVQQPVCTSIIKLLLHRNKWEAAELLYQDMEALGCTPDKVIHYLFVNGFAKAGLLERMVSAFERMCAQPGCKPSLQTYEKMVDALTRADQVDKAMEVAAHMARQGQQGSPFLYNVLIKALGDSGREGEAEDLFQHMRKDGCLPNMVNFNTMLNVHAKAKEVGKMEQLVDEMRAAGFVPDSITYSTRMRGHKLVGDWRKVESLFEEMKEQGHEPNTYSLATLSSAYKDNQQLEKMQLVHRELEAQGYKRAQKDKRWTPTSRQ